MKLLRKNHSRLSREEGASAVEFAVIAPLLLLFIFGMIECSWLLMALHATTGASREAARAAAIVSASDADVTNTAVAHMRDSFFSVDTVDVEIAREASPIEGMENITCMVRIDYDDVSVLGNPLGFTFENLTGTSSMMREEE